MKQSVISVLIMLSSIPASQSQNLVPNPSFEEYLECPFTTGELRQQAIDWFSWRSSPDYFNTCNNEITGEAGVPSNGWGVQEAISGEAYAGLYTFAEYALDEREYMAVTLVDTLIVGETYYMRFYASMYDGAAKELRWCAVSNIGMRFFKDPEYDYQSNPLTPDNFSHLNYGEILDDYVNWTLVEGWFTADEAYNWVALGNFYTDDNTDIIILNEENACSGIIYIEDVCVALSPEECNLVMGLSTNSELATSIIYPNPTSDEVTLKCLNCPLGNSTVELIDVQGRIITTWTLNSIEQTWDVSTYPRGYYTLRIKSLNQISNLKLLLQ